MAPAITWKIDYILNELRDLAKEISRQHVQCVNYFFIVVHYKGKIERDKLKKLFSFSGRA